MSTQSDPFSRGEKYTKYIYACLLEFETRRRTAYKMKNCIFQRVNLEVFSDSVGTVLHVESPMSVDFDRAPVVPVATL